MSLREWRGRLVVVVIVLIVQALLAVAYLNKDRGEVDPAAERVDWQAPELIYRSADGVEHRLSALQGEPLLLHFWASWCPPCRTELPSLLAWAEDSGLRTLAVSVDADWPTVEAYFGGEPPGPVVLSRSSDAADAFRMSGLPDTFVVDAAGRVRLRISGARDWSSEALRKRVLDGPR